MRIAALALLATCALTAGDVKEQILVVVNNHIITRKAYQEAVEQNTASFYREFSGKALDEKVKTARESTLQDLIDGFILEDKAGEMGINIPDDFLRGRIEDIKKNNNFATDADMERALKGSMGIGLSEWMRNQKRIILQQEVLDREVFRKIALEEQELQAYLNEHKEDYKVPARFRIRELVLPKGASPEEKALAQDKLKAIQNALKEGKSFEDLVKEYSVSPSKSLGGDLGWMKLGLLREDLEKAALALKPEQITEPLETDKDYYLIQLIASEAAGVRPLDEVRKEIQDKLRMFKGENALGTYMHGIRLRAHIRYLVPKEDILKG